MCRNWPACMYRSREGERERVIHTHLAQGLTSSDDEDSRKSLSVYFAITHLTHLAHAQWNARCWLGRYPCVTTLCIWAVAAGCLPQAEWWLIITLFWCCMVGITAAWHQSFLHQSWQLWKHILGHFGRQLYNEEGGIQLVILTFALHLRILYKILNHYLQWFIYLIPMRLCHSSCNVSDRKCILHCGLQMMKGCKCAFKIEVKLHYLVKGTMMCHCDNVNLHTALLSFPTNMSVW